MTVPENQESPLLSARSSPGLLLGVIGSTVMRRLRETHTALDLKPRQFELLGLLEEAGPFNQTELADRMGLTASALVLLINPLETAQQVTRDRDPSNRKRNVVTITPAGRELLTAAAQAQHDIDDQLLAPLSAEQRDELARLLKVIRDSDVLRDDSCETPGWVGSPVV